MGLSQGVNSAAGLQPTLANEQDSRAIGRMLPSLEWQQRWQASPRPRAPQQSAASPRVPTQDPIAVSVSPKQNIDSSENGRQGPPALVVVEYARIRLSPEVPRNTVGKTGEVANH